MERSTEQCCGLHRLRQHEQRHHWCHQEQEASTCAAGAVAVVALTAADVTSNESLNLWIARTCAHQLGGAALHGRLLSSNSH